MSLHPEALRVLSGRDFIRQAEEEERRELERGRWGNWRLDRDNLTLAYEPEGRWRYEVDLERCSSSASVLDHICQVAGKSWITAKDLGDLVLALDFILWPQRTLCSFGTDKRIADLPAYLRDRLDPGRAT